MNLIAKELKNSTEFIPADSEHFSLWYGLKNLNPKSIEKIYITASGGSFNYTPLNHFKHIKNSNVIKASQLKMGKKFQLIQQHDK